MNEANYDHVVEVSKHDKIPWIRKMMDYSSEHTDFLGRISERKMHYYICEKSKKLFLIDSNDNETELSYFDIEDFFEIEVEGYIYRRYSRLK